MELELGNPKDIYLEIENDPTKYILFGPGWEFWDQL